MENSEKPVQNTKKKRSQSDKIGRLKYNQQLLKQTLSEVEAVKLMLRTIFAGLKGSFNFEPSLIEHIACIDEVDREILRFLNVSDLSILRTLECTAWNLWSLYIRAGLVWVLSYLRQ